MKGRNISERSTEDVIRKRPQSNIIFSTDRKKWSWKAKKMT
jgi:hypothetical protein